MSRSTKGLALQIWSHCYRAGRPGNTFHKGFRTNGISGKVATIIMPAFGSFILSVKHSISACRKRVHEYQRAEERKVSMKPFLQGT